MSHTQTPQEPEETPVFSAESAPHPREQYEALPWTGITLILAVVGLLLFMAVPRQTPGLPEMMARPRQPSLASAHLELTKAIEAYHAEHGTWPGARPVEEASDEEPVFERIWLVQQLEMCTDPQGFVVPRYLVSHPCGPYLPGGIPFNPVTGSNTVRVVDEGETIESANDGLYGWIYDPRTGRVVPDQSRSLAARDDSGWR